MKPARETRVRQGWLAVLAGVIALAPAAACHSGEAEAHAGRPATTEVSSASDLLEDNRRVVARQLERTLAELDEQIEMLDLIIEGREENRVPEDESDMISEIFVDMYATRAALAEQRVRTVGSIDQVRTARPDEWLQTSWSARLEMEELEASYDRATKSLYR